MRKLHVVGYAPDQGGFVLSARKGARNGSYFLALDDALLAEIERAGSEDDSAEARQPAPAPRSAVSSALTPREIQARLRAGQTIEEVASDAGVDIEWVDRFAAPVLAEQAAAVERAGRAVLHTPRKGPSDRPLDTSVRRNLAERGVAMSEEDFDRGWSARHLLDTDWLITFRFRHRGRAMTAEWLLNATNGSLTTRNRLGADLGFLEPGRQLTATAVADAAEAAVGAAAGATAAGRRRPSGKAPAKRSAVATRPTAAKRAVAAKRAAQPKRAVAAKSAAGPKRAVAAKRAVRAVAAKSAVGAKREVAGKSAAGAERVVPGKRAVAGKSAVVAKGPAVGKRGAVKAPPKPAAAAKVQARRARGGDTTAKPAVEPMAPAKAPPAAQPTTVPKGRAAEAAAVKRPAGKAPAKPQPDGLGPEPVNGTADRVAEGGGARPVNGGAARVADAGAARPVNGGAARVADAGGARPVNGGAARVADAGGARPVNGGAARVADAGAARPVNAPRRPGADNVSIPVGGGSVAPPPVGAHFARRSSHAAGAPAPPAIAPAGKGGSVAVNAASAGELVGRPANDRPPVGEPVAPGGRPLRRTDRPLRANRAQRPNDPTEPVRVVRGQLEESPDHGGIRFGNPD